MTMNRRQLLTMFSALGASSFGSGGLAFANEASTGSTNAPFVIYLHFGSACGANSGLLQPLKLGAWPMGHFQEGKVAGSNNPLINKHYQEASMIFHNYNQFMADIANDMCLVNGNPQNLDHTVGATIQKCGSSSFSSSAEWGMAVAQQSKNASTPNPMFIGNSSKPASVPDVTVVQSNSLSNFQDITRDVEGLPRSSKDPMLNSILDRFARVKLSTTAVQKEFGSTAKNQLMILSDGLSALESAQADSVILRDSLSKSEVQKLVMKCEDSEAIVVQAENGFREKLILAGILAKTGLATGMNIDLMTEDTHAAGSDFTTPRMAAGRWALINLFWKWCKSAGLAERVLIVVGQEFGRSPYNTNGIDVEISTNNGKKMFRSPGRDHGLHMGTMFINANVPNAGRIGIVSDNLSPLATKDSKGTPSKDEGAYTIDRIMGSVFMRVYPDLFPNESAVKKHWSNFKPIPALIA